jgi:hypothetical protein
MTSPWVDHLKREEVEPALLGGGRLVFFEYCISLLIITLRRPSRVVLLRPGERGVLRGMPYSLVSVLFGWWGLPWGVFFTPLTILTNLGGGCDVTAQVKAELGLA